jgi:hypothetical protein
MHNKVRY